jgi:hypothetical protein
VPSLDLLACRLHGIILVRTVINGQLNLARTTLTSPNGIALDGDGLTVERNVLCCELVAEGQVLLRTAHIRGRLVLDDASLRNPRGSALHANRLTVDQDLHWLELNVGCRELARIFRAWPAIVLTARALLLAGDSGGGV